MPQLAGTCGLSCWGGCAGVAGVVAGGTLGAGCEGGATVGGIGPGTQGGVADTGFFCMPAGQDVAPAPSGVTILPLAWDGTTCGALRPVAEAASFFFCSSGSCW